MSDLSNVFWMESEGEKEGEKEGEISGQEILQEIAKVSFDRLTEFSTRIEEAADKDKQAIVEELLDYLADGAMANPFFANEQDIQPLILVVPGECLDNDRLIHYLNRIDEVKFRNLHVYMVLFRVGFKLPELEIDLKTKEGSYFYERMQRFYSCKKILNGYEANYCYQRKLQEFLILWGTKLVDNTYAKAYRAQYEFMNGLSYIESALLEYADGELVRLAYRKGYLQKEKTVDYITHVMNRGEVVYEAVLPALFECQDRD